MTSKLSNNHTVRNIHIPYHKPWSLSYRNDRHCHSRSHSSENYDRSQNKHGSPHLLGSPRTHHDSFLMSPIRHPVYYVISGNSRARGGPGYVTFYFRLREPHHRVEYLVLLFRSLLPVVPLEWVLGFTFHWDGLCFRSGLYWGPDLSISGGELLISGRDAVSSWLSSLLSEVCFSSRSECSPAFLFDSSFASASDSSSFKRQIFTFIYNRSISFRTYEFSFHNLKRVDRLHRFPWSYFLLEQSIW